MIMRKLQSHEIEIRVGTISKFKPSAMLLLYKDARCDMAILDEVYGSENWQSDYTKIDGVLYCKIGVYNAQIKEWVWKQSNGIESQGTGDDDPNNKKGEASDAFKRAGFMWGIGRELYEWKGIWVEHDKEKDKYTEYKVTEISYDDNGEPKSITIVANQGTKNEKVVYQVKNGKRVYEPNQEIKTAEKANNDEPKKTKKAKVIETEPDDVSEQMEKDILNEIKQRNRKIWNDLIFEGVKTLSLLNEYDEEDLKGVANDYLKMFIKKITKKPLTNIEFSNEEKAPELKGFEVVLVDHTFTTAFKRHINDLEKVEVF